MGAAALIATADVLDAPSLEPVEEGLQNGAGHCADLVQDDHTGNEFLSHPFRGPVHLAAPSEEAVIGLGLDAPWPTFLFGSVVYLDLFVIVGMPAEPVVWHFSGNEGRLPLIATADALDSPSLEPVEEGLQSGAGHCADLVSDDHTGNKFLVHPFRRPVRLAAPAEEAVIGLGLDAPGPHFFGQAMGRGEDEGASGMEELDRSHGFAAALLDAGSLMG